MEKIKVLWIDYAVKDELKGAFSNLHSKYNKGTNITFIFSEAELQRVADREELGSFDAVIAHMSGVGLSDFMLRHQEEMLWSRIGIVTDETVGRVAGDVIKKFSPDFLSDYSDDEFIRRQIGKGRVSNDEIEKRGKELLLSSTDVSISEGRIIDKEHGR